MHQVFHVEGLTDPKVQETKLASTGEFGFFHNHPAPLTSRDGNPVPIACNSGCHAVNPKQPAS